MTTPNFDEILKKSLSSINDGYVTAHDDLKTVVEKLSSSVKQYAGEQFDLQISKAAEDLKTVTFRVYLDPDVDDTESRLVTISHFQILAKGYPMLAGVFNKSSNVFIEKERIADKPALDAFFVELLTNPESTLIQALGFALRKKNS